MARSYIDPSLVALASQPVAPPWNWNPGATFVEAFNQAQKNRREQEKMELDKWMSDQLFPLQKQKVALELDKLQGEIERQTLLTQMSREAYKTTHQNFMNGMRDPGGGADAAKRQNTGLNMGKLDALRTGTMQPIQGSDAVDFVWDE